MSNPASNLSNEIEAEVIKIIHGLWGSRNNGDKVWEKAAQALTTLFNKQIEDALQSGFYSGQAMAGVEIYDCHDNWEKWNKEDKTNEE